MRVSKRMKHLVINLPKEAKDSYAEKHKTLLKETVKTQVYGNISLLMD